MTQTKLMACRLRHFVLLFVCTLWAVHTFGKSTFAESFVNTSSSSIKYNAADGEFDKDLKVKLKSLISIVKPRYNDEVKRYVENYVLWHRGFTSDMLGKASIYFPIFESALRKRNLPPELKYLAIIESSLNPHAQSSAGAVGIWQFMPGTAQMYRLRINKHVDERKDIISSSEAAATYLEKLYSLYNDWALAIAAYNSGPGKIDRAIQRAGTTDYWKLEPYLPLETRNYVPRFIAAAYVMNFYPEYDIIPAIVNTDLLLTDYTKIYRNMSFGEISKYTGLPDSIISALNPGFRKNYIPTSDEGFNLLVPKRVMEVVDLFTQQGITKTEIAEMLNNQGNIIPTRENYNWSEQYVCTKYIVQEGDNLIKLAKLFDCDPYHLKIWNNLAEMDIEPGQQLLAYQPRTSFSNTINAPINTALITEAIAPLPIALAGAFDEEWNNKPLIQKPLSFDNYEAYPETTYLYHQVARAESLKDIADQYPGVDIDKILSLNDLHDPTSIRTGTVLKIKEL